MSIFGISVTLHRLLGVVCSCSALELLRFPIQPLAEIHITVIHFLGDMLNFVFFVLHICVIIFMHYPSLGDHICLWATMAEGHEQYIQLSFILTEQCNQLFISVNSYHCSHNEEEKAVICVCHINVCLKRFCFFHITSRGYPKKCNKDQ